MNPATSRTRLRLTDSSHFVRAVLSSVRPRPTDQRLRRPAAARRQPAGSGIVHAARQKDGNDADRLLERSAWKQKGRMGMWQQLLDRFVPLMDGDASALDQRDGVGGASALVVTSQARSADAPFAAGHGRSAFEGSASPLPS